MTDEPREESRPEEEEVEAHLPPTGRPPTGEAHRSDDEDVEAHLPPTGRPPTAEAIRAITPASLPLSVRTARAWRARWRRSRAIAAWFANRPSSSIWPSENSISLERSSTLSTPSARSSCKSGTDIIALG